VSDTSHPKVRSEHVSRKAVVYLRQSTMKQVRENLESQRLQYALAGRAHEIGFADVEIIDCDLGASAGIGSTRKGFERLVSEVALGQVGAVISREVSRLSRTDRDWCHLLEVCQIFDTLIMDEEQIYDLSLIDDQLVLGIKGTMSVVELKVLRMRMLQGREAKARRGELKTRLAPGFAYDANGKMVLHPDQRVRDAISRIFRKFRELWSARQVFMWFHDNQVMVPVNEWGGGSAELEWKLPSLSFIQDVLRNPVYAGAYVHGRRPVEPVFENGKLGKRAGSPREPEDCRIFLQDHHEGYIAWDEYERNRERLRRNSVKFDPDPGTAAVRSGQGLLGGLLRCGHCGRKLHLRYWGRSGTTPRYFCKGDYDRGGNYCLSFGGGKVDRRFSAELLRVLSPLGIEASLRATQELKSEYDERVQARRLELEQLNYEVQRAFEQYDQVDPRNRLVAAELERRWNAKLDEQARVRTALTALEVERQPVTPEVEAELRQLGRCFASVWNDPACPAELKKKVAHLLVEEVTVALDQDAATLIFVVHWKGGCHTKLEAPKPRSASACKTSSDALDIIRSMAVRYGDGQIAAVLNKSGLRTGRGNRWTQTRVATARRNHSIPGQRTTTPDPEVLSLNQAAKYCGVSQTTIQQLVKAGALASHQVVANAPWEIERRTLDSEPLRSILEHTRRTGRIIIEGGHLKAQTPLPFENKQDDNGGYYE